MKILIASDTFVFQTSGAANVVIVLARGLRSRGHDVKVLAPSNDKTSYKDGDNYFIRSTQSFIYPDVRFCLINHDPLLDELTEWKPDLIHLHTEATIARLAYKIAAATKAPVVATMHTDYAHYAFGALRSTPPVRLLMGGLGKFIFRNAELIVVPSEKAKFFAPVQAAGKPIRVIPNGIKLDRFQKPVSAQEKAALFQKTGLEDNGCILVTITRLSHEKNIIEILSCLPALLEILPQAQMLIVGDGPDRKRLEKYCEKNHLTGHVCFTGRIDPDLVYQYYALGDVFVSASTFEVHSLSCLEAMACGLPMVCRDDTSLKGVLDNKKNGYIYHTKNGFVKAVVKILRNQALRESMRKCSLEKSGSFSDDHFVERSLALYEEIVNEGDR